MADRAIPDLTPGGLLPLGDHPAGLAEIEDRFGWNPRRRELIRGLRSALSLLASGGVERAYIGGDLTTATPLPRSVAGCYDLPSGIDEHALARLAPLYPVPSGLPDDISGRSGLELFAAATGSRDAGEPFLDWLRRGWDRPGPERGVLVVRPEVASSEGAELAPAGGAAGRRRAIRDEEEKAAAEARLGEIHAEISALATPGQSPAVRGAVAGLWHLVASIEEDLELYGRLAAGEVTLFGAQDLRGFGEALVKARLSRGMDVEELAAAVGLDTEELGRHDRKGYQSAPLWLLDGVANAVAEEMDTELRLPRPERTGPWSVLEEISEGRAVVMRGQGTLTLQVDRYERDADPPPNGPGGVDVSLSYHPAESGDLDVRVSLSSRDADGGEILSWKPENPGERTTPRYVFDGDVDAPDGTVKAAMAPVYVDFSHGAAGHALGQDSAHGLSAGPGLGSAPERLRALVPNLYVDAAGETGGLRFALTATGEVQPDGVFPDQVGKIVPGSYLELEQTAGGDADLEEAVKAFGFFLSFYAGRAVHPIVWEAETPSGPYWTVQSVRKSSRLPDKFRRTCLPAGALSGFLTQAWGDWVGFDGKTKDRLQGAVTAYESILYARFPIYQIALTAMYLERFRDYAVGDSDLLPRRERFGSGRKSRVAKMLRDALKDVVEATDLLSPDQKEVLAGVLDENSGIVLGLFRKSFKQSLMELHERADLPVEEEKIGEFVRKRNPVLHGSWDASGRGTVDTYWVARYGTAVLERLILRRFGYSGVYWDRDLGRGETMLLGSPFWRAPPPGNDGPDEGT